MEFKIKGMQIDLARQKETVEFILSFIDFIKKSGFNTLFLYLEGRIKTPSFPFPENNESYTAEEIKEIVKYARKKEIDTIPVISTLGHTEMFLKYPQLKVLSELNGDIEGRWFKKGFHNMTCPLNEDVYKFFENYFAEVIPLFNSEYFHVGLDECDEIGMCERCRKVVEEKGADFLYSYHINRIYKIIKKFKKKMMMWDDMFDIYSKVLDEIPKDIIMCTWDYNYFVYSPHTHFSNLEREYTFRKYKSKGFKYLFCTGLLIPNIYSFTNYANNYEPLGGLITNWERSNKFQFECYPAIAFGGKYWNSDGKNVEQLIEKTIEEFVKGKEKIEGLKKYYFSQFPSYNFSNSFIRGEVEPLEEQFYREEKLLYSIFGSEKNNVIIDEISLLLDEKITRFEIRKHLFENLFNEENDNKIKDLLNKIEDIKKKKLIMWEKYRKGILSKIDEYYNSIFENVNGFLQKKKESNCFLILKFFLPDIYGTPFLNVDIYGEKGGKIEIVNKTMFKPPHPDISYYSYVFPFYLSDKIKEVELKIYGYGGQGISFIKVVDKNGVEFLPESINEISGVVECPTDLLVDNLRWAYLGLREIKKGYKLYDYRKFEHSIKIKMGDNNL